VWSDCPHWAAKYLVEQGIIRVEAQRQQKLIALAKRYAAHEIIGLESRVKVRALWRQFFAARGIEPMAWNIKSLPYSELDYSSKTEPTMQEAEALFLSTWKRHCAALFYFEKLAPYTVEDSVMQAFKKQVENSLLLLEISAKEAGRTAGQIAAAKQMLIEQMERSAGLKYNV
jgi:hypothetical protein